MSDKISHTVRFHPEQKAKIEELAQIHGHGKFQTEMDLVVKYYLQNHQVTAFLARVQCALDAMSVGQRTVMMAEIANLIGIELE